MDGRFLEVGRATEVNGGEPWEYGGDDAIIVVNEVTTFLRGRCKVEDAADNEVQYSDLAVTSENFRLL